jgi:pimeloyl-ACP methyl ester carboxylesterase
MSTYVLVHGAWHGAWCWEKLAPLLEQAGHTVITPDLPCHGEDSSSLADASLASYTEKIVDIIQAQPEPVILVGHSMGGMVISQAAETCPERIQTLVYVCAFLLQNGQSLLEVTQTDSSSLILPNLIDNGDGSASLNPSALKDMFFAACDEADMAACIPRLCPEPMAPVSTPMRTNPESYSSVPRVYIECLEDRAISLESQRKMHSNTPCDQIISLDSDHSPYISCPQELAECLLAQAKNS